MDINELREKYLNSADFLSKLFIWLGIVRIVGFKQHSFNKEYWVNLKFNYWNPLTYVYLVFMFLFNSLPYVYHYGVKDMWSMVKKELCEGFGEWIK